MVLFIKSNDYQVLDVVEDGPFIPMKRDDDRMIPKVKVEMTDEERRRMQVNDKALHMLFCALGPDMYSKLSSCTRTKEVWNTLGITYEGTNDINETKIGFLNLSYKNFKMEPDDNVTKMFDHFSIIVNGLKGIGEVIPEDKIVRKLLYSLPESWDSKRTAIIEVKDLKTLKLNAFMGSLLTHEIMKQASQEESDSSGEDDDEEMTMLTKRFTRFMKSQRARRFQRKGDFKNKNKEEEKNQPICYECKRPGLIRSECPQLKKKSFGKNMKLKAQISIWSDEESSDEEEQEVVNLCFMTLEEDPKVTSNSSPSDLTYDGLLEEYEELQELKMKNMQTNQKDLEKKNRYLHSLLSKVRDDHLKEVDDLNASLSKVEKNNFEKPSSSKYNYVKRNFNDYKQRSFHKTSKGRRNGSVKQVKPGRIWVKRIS
ncbi:hypothetical protein GQ457_07G009480 [Hibiscus cannabinus]